MYTLYDKQGNVSQLPLWVNIDYYVKKGFTLEKPVTQAEPTPKPKTREGKKRNDP